MVRIVGYGHNRRSDQRHWKATGNQGGTMRFHMPTYMASAALVSGIVVALTWSVSAAQAAGSRGASPAGFGTTTVAVAIFMSAALALVIGGVVHAVLIDRRELALVPAVEPARLPLGPARN